MRDGRLLSLDLGTFPTAAATMAADQILLESVAAFGQPILRLYQWPGPTLSLGYFQKHDDRQQHRESLSLPCVRRATGGGAIVHDRELTYSLAVPSDGRSPGANQQLYRSVHGAILETLHALGVPAQAMRDTTPSRTVGALHVAGSAQRQGDDAGVGEPFLCFQRRTAEDLVLCGYKILGSAQRKGRGALLQHGSLLLRASFAAPQLPGICDLGYRISRDELSDQLVSRLGNVLDTRWNADVWTDAEKDQILRLAASRFDDPSWLRRR